MPQIPFEEVLRLLYRYEQPIHCGSQTYDGVEVDVCACGIYPKWKPYSEQSGWRDWCDLQAYVDSLPNTKE